MKTILKNLCILNPHQNLNITGDILIEDGIIKEVGKVSTTDIDRTFDLSGCVCAPGFFDMHVHFREPGREDEETIVSGCNSAAAGGFTGVALMPNTSPTIDSAEVVEFIKQKNKNCLTEVFIIGAATKNRKGEALSPMAELHEAGCVAFSDDGVALKTAKILRTAMEYAGMFGLPIIDHCEDETLSLGAMNESINSTRFGLSTMPPIAEYSIVSRDILMAEYTGSKLHVSHISTAKAVDMVRQAKKDGLQVTSEVTPHHFSLTDDSLAGYDTNFKMCPPLRTQKDIDAILTGLKDGTIDCIATDHAPHSAEEKEAEFEYAPNGILGLETAIGLSITELVEKGVLSIDQLIEKFAIAPKRILNIPVPMIEEGEPANLTIFNPTEKWIVKVAEFKSKSRNSPWNGTELTGKPIAVINRGEIYCNGSFSKI